MDRMSLVFLAATSALITPAQAGVLDQGQIAEASERFAVPAAWIRAVIEAESGGRPKAVSSKGAMGLMQLMPETWAEMRVRYALGDDPFDPRANILAGTAFLKMMDDRFGYPALFAAYHAGAARYEQSRRTGKPLPAETLAYITEVEKALPGQPESTPDDPLMPVRIASGTRLFFRLSSAGNSENSVSSQGLFVPLTTRKAGDQ